MLLQLVVLGGVAHAQTITNVAQADWTDPTGPRTTLSNPVDLEVSELPVTITTYQPTPGSGTVITFQPSSCGSQSAQTGGGGSTSAAVLPSDEIRVGQNLYFQVNIPSANVDSGAVDSLEAQIKTSTGDTETIIIYETGPDTGVFVGEIPTIGIPPAVVSGDCRLSLVDGATIDIGITRVGGTDIVISTSVTVLADPFGVVFDSETGEPVTGAIVTLVDATTGLPATVFAEDGTTPWPSTVIAGQPITDGNGNVYPMGPGEYWFPLTALGDYRLEVQPPAPYTAPSEATPEELATLERPGGGQFVINDGSYGGIFSLVDPTPVQIDIPLDRPAIAVDLTKTASRDRVQPGDVVFYTVTARNSDPSRVRRDVTLVDTPSSWLRLRQDSIRLNGAPAPDAVDVTADGRQLTVRVGDLAGGAQARLTYAMVVRADAPPGQAENRVVATDVRGRTSTANAVIDIERDTIAGRMTLIGRITAGTCDIRDPRVGIPGVRVMLQDGSFAITDADGRYHFEGLVPGTHVVQAAENTLPEGGEFIDCYRSSRSAGSTTSRFVIGQGGSLLVADFHAVVPEGSLKPVVEDATAGTPEAGIVEGAADRVGGEAPQAKPVVSQAEKEAIGDVNWLALGDGEDGWLFPDADHNPRVPSIRVAIRHRKGQSAELFVDGEPASKLTFEGIRTASDGHYAVSLWRGVQLEGEKTVLTANIMNSLGGVSKEISRDVYFTSQADKVELVKDQSQLVADGVTRPVVAVRVTDRHGRPVRGGISGEFTVNAPYQSASQIEQQQLLQLTGGSGSTARWTVEGTDGIALIELAPTMISGSVRLDFRFADGEITREQELETWIEPGDVEWTVVGLAEGSIGARTVADNMERAGNFDSDLGDKARVAFYAKGRVLGKYLLTLAYDSAKQPDDQRLLGTLDPNAYYTVFADGSSRRFDAASREKLYVRIETATFYALYGDFQTGFDQTQLARYNRTATGIKAEARFGQVQAQAFAAEIDTRFRKDEIQGQGISGPYRLSSRAIIANSEKVAIETRDRLRSEVIVDRRELTRFIDYDIDLLSGTITFSEPVLSRDFDLNPQFIVVDYEVDELTSGEWNAGVRAAWTDKSGKIRIGATAITDKGEEARTNIGAVDLRARVGENTEVRAEVAMSRSEGKTASGYLVEVEHRAGPVDLLAYVRSLDADYGVGQQSGAERGRRKVGVDARYQFSENASVVTSFWRDDSLTDSNRRNAARVTANYRTGDTDLQIGIAHLNDRLDDGTKNKSTVLEGGVTQRLFDNKLELSASSAIALDQTESIDLPTRHRFAARYAITPNVKLVGLYEIANGENIDARTVRGGLEVTPWQGGRFTTTLGQQRIDENGNRSFAAFGLAQTLQVSPTLTVDATLDGSRTLGGTGNVSDIINPAQPVSSGGQLGQDGSLFEDFTAVTLGAAYRKDRWSATLRGEYRDGEFADRHGVTFGAVRQLGEGSIVGSGFTWTEATGENGTKTEIFDGAIAFAHRPDASEIAMLGKLEFRSDSVTGAIAGETGPAGRTALTVTGDAQSRRLIGSLSTNWSPRGYEELDEIEGIEYQYRRSELGLFVGARYNFDRYEGFDLSGFTALAGVDARIGIGERFEIGAAGTVRANLTDNTTSFAFGPNIGFVPADGMLLTIGYNIEGFRDEDFSASRNTDKGIYASARIKFDADTFGFLGLGR
ncbi:TonB-dependent receptor [Pontixanthobacter aquaemixtae]|uniref:DUF11 domain-containing protein n=1 Tax=Pontixanthobacter aquaemixtae TaxID=1958940 RepID=A0A844ZR43_9SPHN|nr:TonB-dependent receptor [Pontixanthobacter aquaemixtae]MXO90004.1 DUF11 domain-containing protein [Pontixanthobacter aquaemixtae]